MGHFQRRHSFRDPKKFFIIATEGECTEEVYFAALKPPRDAAIQIKVLPTKKGRSNPKKVLARLKSYERETGSGKRDELWLIVDRDSWNDADLDEIAREIASLSKYHLALSNPCFELWLVLHFRETACQTSAELQNILKKELGAYSKNSYDTEPLKQNVDCAIDRARRMDTAPQELWPHKPGTHVYRLVMKLRPTA